MAANMKLNLKLKGEYDYGLMLIVAAIITMGLFAIYSAAYQKYVLSGANLSLRQLNSAVIGVIVAVLVFRVGYQRLIDFGYYLFAINIVLLVLVLVIGDVRYGARGGVEISLFSFYPS